LNSLIKKAVGYIRFLQKEYLWKNRGMESETHRNEDRIIKIYNDLYYRNNIQFNRRGELYFIEKYSFDFMPQNAIRREVEGDELWMDYAGEPIGKRYITRKDIPLVELVAWLSHVKKTLKKADVWHRDINPSNICYDQVSQKFTLIDWAWATELFYCEDGADVNYKRYRDEWESDETAISTIQEDCIKLLCTKLGTNNSAGSSIFNGHAYHKVPMIQGVKTHKDTVEFEFDEILKYACPETKGKKILDIGCSVGYNTIEMVQRGAIVTAYEPDIHSLRVARAVGHYSMDHGYWQQSTPPTIKYIMFTECEQDYDLCIMMNVSMWILKQSGWHGLEMAMESIAKHCKTLVYQTAHAESKGDCVIEEFKNKDDIREHLLKAGFKSVEWIRDTGRHGGIRSLFVCKQ